MSCNINNHLPELSYANSRINVSQLQVKHDDIKLLRRFIIVILGNEFTYLF